MSLGIGAYARKVLEDENTVIYEYGGFNLNDPDYRNEDRILDGMITIQRDCFAEPEIHEKLKKMSSGKKKLVTKRIPVSVDYDQMLEDGRIVVENCSHCWKTTETEKKVDVMACHLLFYIFLRYQEEDMIPENMSSFR